MKYVESACGQSDRIEASKLSDICGVFVDNGMVRRELSMEKRPSESKSLAPDTMLHTSIYFLSRKYTHTYFDLL